MEGNGDKVFEFNSNQYEVFRTDVKIDSIETKSVKWKYFACALFINMILSSPVYIYGLFIVQERNANDVLPPIVFNSVYLMLTPKFFNFKSYSMIHRLSDRTGIVVGVIITSVGITINGLVLSSSDPYYLIGTLFYGGLGGLGTCLTMAKVWHALNRIYQMENLYWINSVYSTGQSLCQFIFPYTFNTFINAYGSQSAVILMGSVVLNALPLCLIITQANYDSTDGKDRNPEMAADRYSDMPGYFANFDLELDNAQKNDDAVVTEQTIDETLSKQFWQNPGKQLDLIDGKMINSFGVEIMDMIEEESEEELDDHSISSILVQRCELITIPETGRFEIMKLWILFQARHLTDIFYQHVIHHVQRAFRANNFLPLVLLKSSDIYSYVLCVTVLPHIAATQYGLDSNETSFLLSSLAFPWVIVAVSTPFQGNSFNKNQKQIFVLSGLLKIVGLFFILISTSKILLTLSSALIGFSQGTSFLLQDEIIRSTFSQTEWKYLRSSVYFFTGFLLLIFGMILNLGFTSFGECLGFSLGLFTFSFVCWILFPHIRSVWISFQNARK